MRRRPTSLRVIRVAAGISLTEISRRTGIGMPRLGRIERAIVRPTEEELARMLSALGPDAAAALKAARRLLRHPGVVGAGGPEPNDPEAA